MVGAGAKMSGFLLHPLWFHLPKPSRVKPEGLAAENWGSRLEHYVGDNKALREDSGACCLATAVTPFVVGKAIGGEVIIVHSRPYVSKNSSNSSPYTKSISNRILCRTC